jgi:hypothetical protein
MTRHISSFLSNLARFAATVAVVAPLFILLLLPGCRHTESNATSTPPQGLSARADSSLVLGIASDESGSQNIAARDDGFVLSSAVIDEAVPPNTTVLAWAFASPREVRKIWGSQVSDATDLAELHRKFRVSFPDGPGTHVTPLLKAFERAALEAQLQGHNIAFLILTDGEWSDYDKARPVAAALARLHNVKAILIGPLPTRGYARTHVESTLAAFGSDRLIVCNTSEAGAAITRFRAACQRS